MSRGLASEQEVAVAGRVVYPRLLFDFEFLEDPLFLWTGFGDIQANNVTYTGAGTLLSFDAVSETIETLAASVTFQLAGVTQELLALAGDLDWQGRPCRVWLVLLDPETRQAIGDPFQIFAGMMDQLVSKEDTGSAIIEMTGENQLADLDRARVRRYTDRDQQAEYPGDLGFQYVASLQEQDIQWGA